MPRRIAAMVLVLAAAALGGCVSCDTPTRFWRAQDRTTGRVGYTVDTVECPLGTRLDAVYLDSAGHEVSLGAADLQPMTEAEWRAAAGGADFDHAYCPRMQVCWALPVPE